MSYFIREGWGFNVGQNFARADKDIPIEINSKAYASPGNVIGTIAANPESSLGFLRGPDPISVCVQKRALGETE